MNSGPAVSVDDDLPNHSSRAVLTIPPDSRSVSGQTAIWLLSMRMPLLAWIVHVAVVVLTVAVTVKLTPARDNLRPDGSGIWGLVISPLSTWDGAWYLGIAEHGYGHRESSAAFWPLYPTLVSIGRSATGLSYGSVGVLLSNLFFLGSLLMLFALIRESYGEKVASRAVWFTSLSPLAFFFSTAYTEALFLLLTTVALLLAQRNRWTAASLVVVLVCLTRNTGVLILLPLMAMLVYQRGWSPGNWWTRALQLGVAGLAPAAFAVHLDRVWGDPLLTVRVQERWGRSHSLPWNTIADAVHRMHRIYATGRHSCEVSLSEQSFHSCRAAFQLQGDSVSNDLSFVVLFGALAALAFAVFRLQVWDSSFLAIGLLVPLFGPSADDPLLSMARYVLVLYPVYIVLAMVVTRRAAFLTVLVISTLAMIGLLAMFAQGYFVA